MKIDTKEFIEQLLKSDNDLQLTVTFHVVGNDESLQRLGLCDILGLDKERINKTGQKIIEVLEHDKDIPKDLYNSLKWKILAFLTIQDAFRGIVHTTGEVNSLFYKSYFYYESIHILREFFYCGFNNFQVAAEHLLRTIVEFSIKQNYFDSLCMQQGSFAPLEKYLDNGIAPDPIRMLGTFLPDSDFAKPLKKNVQVIMKGLSNSSSHAYMPIHSARATGKLQHEYSTGSLFFWASLLPVLDSILWMYYFQLPQLFNPKDVVRKFGFNLPVGCFINQRQHVAIKKSLKPPDYKMFRKIALASEEVTNLNTFYESQGSMTDDDIFATYDGENSDKPSSIETGYYQAIVQLRASQEVMANQCAIEAAKKFEEREDIGEIFDNVSQYDWWLKSYKSIR